MFAAANKIVGANEKLTDILVFREFGYFLTATSFGNIFVWKYEKSSNLVKNQVHQFEGHIKKVCSLQKVDDSPGLFLSASRDGTYRVWSIKNFTSLYTLEIPYLFGFARIFPGAQKIVTQTNDRIQISKLHLTINHYMVVESKVRCIERGFKSVKD